MIRPLDRLLRRQTSPRPRRAQVQLAIETLEPRSVMAASAVGAMVSSSNSAVPPHVVYEPRDLADYGDLQNARIISSRLDEGPLGGQWRPDSEPRTVVQTWGGSVQIVVMPVSRLSGSDFNFAVPPHMAVDRSSATVVGSQPVSSSLVANRTATTTTYWTQSFVHVQSVVQTNVATTVPVSQSVPRSVRTGSESLSPLWRLEEGRASSQSSESEESTMMLAGIVLANRSPSLWALRGEGMQSAGITTQTNETTDAAIVLETADEASSLDGELSPPGGMIDIRELDDADLARLVIQSGQLEERELLARRSATRHSLSDVRHSLIEPFADTASVAREQANANQPANIVPPGAGEQGGLIALEAADLLTPAEGIAARLQTDRGIVRYQALAMLSPGDEAELTAGFGDPIAPVAEGMGSSAAAANSAGTAEPEAPASPVGRFSAATAVVAAFLWHRKRRPSEDTAPRRRTRGHW